MSEQTIILGKLEGGSNRGRQNMSWTDSKREPQHSFASLKQAVNSTTFWSSLTNRVITSWDQLDNMKPKKQNKNKKSNNTICHSNNYLQVQNVRNHVLFAHICSFPSSHLPMTHTKRQSQDVEDKWNIFRCYLKHLHIKHLHIHCRV